MIGFVRRLRQEAFLAPVVFGIKLGGGSVGYAKKGFLRPFGIIFAVCGEESRWSC